ncbi:Mediator-associated protein 1 [Apostasia shenzhenica]|uniref:Mediator-associated protein 1 n=1 Tax=Apostasia shenzhenica TaxID=1088818 RepID=A0A2I0AM30_9ASPA|nr:Mediator-associated protein 1 [Apostasia shenzhenica]
MPPAEEEEEAVFDDDDELEDTDGDDSDMDDDDDDDEEEDSPEATHPLRRSVAAQPLRPPNAAEPVFTNPNPNLDHSYTISTADVAAPQNGSMMAAPVVSEANASSSQAVQFMSPAAESRRSAAISGAVDDSRRLFQRLWTEEDEIKILQGFLEFTTQRGTTHASHQYDTGPFYEQTKKQLQLDFNKNQLIEKLRRLKKKYRNVVSRMVSGKEFSFKSAHEQTTYEISRKIWSSSIKRGRDSDDDEFNPNPASAIVELSPAVTADGAAVISGRRLSRRRRIKRRAAEEDQAATVETAVEVPIAVPTAPASSAPIPSLIEEAVKSCLSPLFKELIQSAMAGPPEGLIPAIISGNGGGFFRMNPLQLEKGNLEDEKWRNQHILELEVYLKRIELMRDQIKSALDELKAPLAGDS